MEAGGGGVGAGGAAAHETLTARANPATRERDENTRVIREPAFRAPWGQIVLGCYAGSVSDVFLPLRDLEALEAALAGAAAGPILLFKHSPTCGISAQAHAEIGEWLDRAPEGVPPVYLISVREHRAVSSAVSERFGIRHESPQVLLIDATGVRWHASHFRVSPVEIRAALDKLAVSAR